MEITDEQRNILVQLHEQLGQVLSATESQEDRDASQEEYWQNRLRVLCDVVLKGGVVTHDEWGQIGYDNGYDRRGLGGFFTGNTPSMISTFNGKKSITEEGYHQAKEYVAGTHWTGTKPTDDDLEKYAEMIS